MRKIYTKTFVYFAEIQYIYNEINNRNIIMDILNFTYYFLIYNLIFNSNIFIFDFITLLFNIKICRYNTAFSIKPKIRRHSGIFTLVQLKPTYL